MRFRGFTSITLFLILTLFASTMPACRPAEATESYMAVIPKVLHSGNKEAVSLTLLKGQRLISGEVEVTLAFVFRGIPEHIRSNNGPEFRAKAIHDWLNHLGVKTLFIEPGSPWENSYIEPFNGKLRDELLNREIFTTLL